MSDQVNDKAVETVIEEPKVDKGDTVSRDAYEKAIREKKNVTERLKQLELEKTQRETEVLKQKEDYKTMYELTEKAKLDLEGQLAQVKQKEVESYKYTAFKKECEKNGLRDAKQAENLFKLLNQEALKFDEEHKIVLGVEEETRRVKEMFAPLFGQSTAGVSHAAPQGSPTVINAETYNAMMKDGSFHKLSKLEQREITSKVWGQFGVKRN